jgi:hypothetical protein
MNTHTRSANTFAGLMAIAATGTTLYAGITNHGLHPVNGLALLALAAATSRMKVRLPGLTGTMSVNLPFLLTAAVNLSSLETAVIAAVCGLVQSWPKSGQAWKLQQAWFNVNMMVLAATLTSLLFHSGSSLVAGPLGLAAAALSLFLGQTAPVSAIIAITEGAAVRRVWLSIAHLSFPYYVASAGLASFLELIHRNTSLLLALTALAILYGMHRSFRTYFRTMPAAQAAPAPLASAARA